MLDVSFWNRFAAITKPTSGLPIRLRLRLTRYDSPIQTVNNYPTLPRFGTDCLPRDRLKCPGFDLQNRQQKILKTAFMID